jgi:hypothetical protein
MATNWDGVKNGLAKYNAIMEKLRSVDVSTDRDFQKHFNHFYRMRQRSPEFYEAFYAKLQASKEGSCPTFAEVLDYFWERLHRVEPSFSSKLVATINPEMPVWDQQVLKNLKLKAPLYGDRERLSKTKKLYDSLKKWYHDYLNTDDSRSKIADFDQRFPNSDISDLKKIDLILWQTR